MLGLALASAVAMVLAGCGSSGPRPRPRAAAAPAAVSPSVPSVLRDTIGAQASIEGTEPLLISSYGLVAGLKGTGTRVIPDAIRASMEREMTRFGVGSGEGPFGDVSPSELLSDPNTAVVVVQATMPPGAPVGTKFDVIVTALPGSGVTSLEGGMLYTCQLRRGMVAPSVPATDVVAEARGPVFINPFLDPARSTEGPGLKTAGRVLDGGEVVGSLPLAMFLNSPSYARVQAIVGAINTRFPRQAPDREPTARGKNDEVIEINIPSRFSQNADEFLMLLIHLDVQSVYAESRANRYVQALKENTDLAEPIGWALQAIGEPSIPFVRQLYEYSDQIPRLTAMQVGARLRDPLVTPHLQDLVLNGPPNVRVNAMNLLADMDSDPKINRFMREQLDSDDLAVRLAAAEGLLKRGDVVVNQRRLDAGFEVVQVPSAQPMVYITQQKAPRIIIFGDITMNRPVFISAWDDRLLVNSSESDPMVGVFYRDWRTGRATESRVRPELPEVIEFMAHTTTPEEPAPGLAMSYSEVVGAVYELVNQGGLAAAFVPEEDRLRLAILRASEGSGLDSRPELSEAGAIDRLTLTPDMARVAGGAPVGDDAVSADEELPIETAPLVSGQQPTGRKKYVVPVGPAPQPADEDKPSRESDR